MAPTSYRGSCTNNSYQRFPSHTRSTLLPLPTLMTQPRAITGRRDSIAKLTRSLFNSKTNSPRSYSALNLYKRNASFLNQIGGTPSSLHSSENVIEDSSHSGRSNSPNIEERDGEDEPDLTLGIKDPKVLQTVAKHLNNSHEDGLAAEGADITRALYKLSNDSRPGLKRSKSDLLLEPGSRRGSTASHLRVPGGFRRHFILAKNKRTPSLITRNFVEFLSIYGHFAGEDLEGEEDLACHYEPYLPYGEDTPLLPSDVNPNGTASDTKAYFLLLKAFVGTGVLFLPKAFSSGGLLFSAVVLFLFGLLSFWCYYILVQSKVATKVSGFAEIGLKTYGVTLQRLILFSIIISQIGFVAAYIVFTAENLRAFLVNISSYQTRDLDISGLSCFKRWSWHRSPWLETSQGSLFWPSWPTYSSLLAWWLSYTTPSDNTFKITWSLEKVSIFSLISPSRLYSLKSPFLHLKVLGSSYPFKSPWSTLVIFPKYCYRWF